MTKFSVTPITSQMDTEVLIITEYYYGGAEIIDNSLDMRIIEKVWVIIYTCNS